MTRLTGALLAAAILCPGSVLAAQERPDFSGDWTIEEAPGARGGRAGRGGRGGPAPDMGSGWGRNITITQDAARLTVEYAFFSRGDFQPPLKFHYALDGSTTTNSVMMGRGIQERGSVTAWDGDTLVIRTTHAFTDPATGEPSTVEVTRKLWLESPSRLRVESIFGGALGGPPATTQTTYTRG